MVSFPNSKINLGLSIAGKRPDGYHALETVFYPLPFTDTLEIIEAPDSTSEIALTVTGLVPDGNNQDNLCCKAYRLLKAHYPSLPPVTMYLHKAIPSGAGLGGGSADAAFTLSLLNNKFELGISRQRLLEFALELGSDCPFFIINAPCLATGRGEILEPIELDLSTYQILLFFPGIPINTGWAFGQLKHYAPPKIPISRIIQQPIETWKGLLINDFEAPIFAQHPLLQNYKDQCYQQGALYAAMSGSGSTLFGIFEKAAVPKISLEPGGSFKLI